MVDQPTRAPRLPEQLDRAGKPPKRMSEKRMRLIFARVYLDTPDGKTVGPYRLEDLSVAQLEYFQGQLRQVLRERRKK